MTDVHVHRARIAAYLLPADQGGLRIRLADGNQSLIYVFEAPEEDEGVIRFGGVLDAIEGGQAGGKLVARLTFWSDVAELYARRGAEFKIWYGRIVGAGTVTAHGDEGSEQP